MKEETYNKAETLMSELRTLENDMYSIENGNEALELIFIGKSTIVSSPFFLKTMLTNGKREIARLKKEFTNLK